MIMPSIPTDNLYKFMAISGLAIAALGLILPASALIRLNREVASIETAMDILEEETTGLEKRVSLDQRRADLLERLVDSQEKTPDDSVDRERLLEMHDKLLDTLIALNDAETQLRVNMRELQGRTKMLRLESAIGRWLGVILGIASAGGAVLGVFGFRLWYARIQQPQDRAHLGPGQAETHRTPLEQGQPEDSSEH